MRTRRAWRLTIAAIVSIAAVLPAAVARAEDEDQPPSVVRTESRLQTWYRRWFVPVPVVYTKSTPPRKRETPKPTATKPDKPKAKPIVDQSAEIRAREEGDLLRRLAVCDKLRQVALETNDEQLRRRAEELDRQAWAAYNLRTGQLDRAGLSQDEDVLNKRLATKTKPADKSKGLLPATAQGKNRGQTGKEER